MDCRTFVILALCAAAPVGCQTTTKTVASGPNAHAPTGAVVQSKDPPRKPKAETIVSLAKVRADQAEDREQSSDMKVKLRDDARRMYQEAIQLEPNCIAAYRGLAQVYLKLTDTEHAIETMHTALKINPKSAALWVELAMCHNCRKEYEQAVQSFNKAIELEPENHEYAKKLGFTLVLAGRTDASVALLTKTWGKDNAHYDVAQMLYQMKQDDACKQQLRLALQANPDHVGALGLLVELEGTVIAGTAPVPTALAHPSAEPQPTVRSSAE